MIKAEFTVFRFDTFSILIQFADAEALIKKLVGKRAMNKFGPYLDAVETICFYCTDFVLSTIQSYIPF